MQNSDGKFLAWIDQYKGFVIGGTGFLITILLAVLVPFLSGYMLQAFITFFLTITFAMSWNIISGFVGKINFGHVVSYGIGAYTTAILMDLYSLSPFITCILGGLMAAVYAVIVGYPLLRLKGAYFAVAMLGVAFAMKALATNLHVTHGGMGISYGIPPDLITFYYAFLGLVIFAVLLSVLISNSKFGLGLFAVREGEEMARSLGINSTLYKIGGFAASSFLLGISGGLQGFFQTYITPGYAFRFKVTSTSILATVLGGRGTLLGPIIGGGIMRLFNELISYRLPGVVNVIFYGVLFILVIEFLPGGVISLLRSRWGGGKLAE